MRNRLISLDKICPMNLTIKRKRFGVYFFIITFITIMDIPDDNRQFYKILNDDDLLSQFIRDQNLAKRSDDHTCHCGSSMVDGTRKKKLRDGTTKIYPTMRCTNKLCRNQLSVRKNTFFSFADSSDRPNSKLDIRTIMEIIWLWCLETPSKTIAKLVNVSQATMVNWTNFLREVCVQRLL